jgi:hypothetical protein
MTLTDAQAEVWSCGICGDANVPEKWRVFGSCYKCAANKSVAKRNDKIARLEADRSARIEREKALVGILSNAQWGAFKKDDLGITVRCCPYCIRERDEGHTPDCAIASALAHQDQGKET